MKTLLMTLSLFTILSTQAHAHPNWSPKDMLGITATGVTFSPCLAVMVTTGMTKDLVRKHAAKMINEGQEYFVDGNITPFLSAAVSDVQAVYNDEFSQDEIIDKLMTEAEVLLNN